MSRPRTYKTEAVVLKQTPLGEADRILSLYTPDVGKIRAVAKGVRRTKSKLGGHLELLNHVSVALSQGRNLDVVTEAEAIRVFQELREDLWALSRALYVAELVEDFSAERSPNHAVYRLLLDTLGWLEGSPGYDLLLRYFEMQLLDHSGFRPEFFSCVECRSTLDPADHLFDSAKGGILCPHCRGGSGQPLIPVSLNGMKVLRFLQRRRRYDEVSELRLSPGLQAEVEALLRTYIRFLAERELKSTDFMSRVSAMETRVG